MNCPLISVIIPTFNQGIFIEEAIESVLGQTYKNIEIIVVDDGSTDNTEDILKKYDRQITYIYQSNAGPSSARNRGIRFARGKYIAFLDADDVWVNDKLELQLEVAEKSSEKLGLFGCSAYTIDSKGRIQKKWTPKQYRTKAEFLRQLSIRNDIVGGTSGAFIRNEVFSKVGFFREDLRFGEDWDMWLRIARHYDIKFLEKPLVLLRKHNSPKNYKNVSVIRDNILQIISDNLRKNDRLTRRKALSFLYLDLARICLRENRRMRSALFTLKSILAYPFKISSEDLKFVMVARLLLSKWRLQKGQANR